MGKHELGWSGYARAVIGKYILVAVDRPLDSLFTYRLPPELEAALDRPLVPGHRLRVPFGRGEALGFFVQDAPDEGRETKDVLAVLDGHSPFNDGLFELLQFAARYYRVPLGEALRTALMPPLTEPRPAPKRRKGTKKSDALAVASADPPEPTQEQRAALERIVGLVEARAFAPTLLHGVTGSGKTEVYLRAIARALDLGLGALVLVPEIALTPQLVGRFRSRFGEKVAVLHSGLRQAERHADWLRLRFGEAPIAVGVRSAIFAPVERLGLVIVDEEHDGSFKQEDRFRYHARDLAVKRAQLAGCPILLGSATPSAETLQNARDGKYGLIELTRRVDDRPMPRIEIVDLRECGRGHVSAAFPQLAGRVKLRAAMKAKAEQALARPGAGAGAGVEPRSEAASSDDGSASDRTDAEAPSVSLAGSGEGGHAGIAVRRLALEAQAMSESEDGPRGPPLLSTPLQLAMAEVLAARRQTILFLNRRGHSTYLLCLECGRSTMCGSCAVSMTLHQTSRRTWLQCHYCGSTRPVPVHCPECRGPIEMLGMGTERVEAEVRALFPEARVARLDRDVVETADEVTAVLSRFARGDADILIGTQMVAKGHDFPGVTLAGIILADQAMNLPDFRASERTFQLLLQVAGRAGRGMESGRVIVQTFSPDAPVIEALRNHDFAGFMSRELEVRRSFRYPPFTKLLAVRLDGRDAVATEAVAREVAVEVAAVIRRGTSLRLLGPCAAPIARIKGMTRWQMLIKGPTPRSLVPVAEAVEQAARKSDRRIRVSLDFDPLTLL